MRHHLQIPALGRKIPGVIALVSGHRHSLLSRNLLMAKAASLSAVPVASKTVASTISPLRGKSVRPSKLLIRFGVPDGFFGHLQFLSFMK